MRSLAASSELVAIVEQQDGRRRRARARREPLSLARLKGSPPRSPSWVSNVCGKRSTNSSACACRTRGALPPARLGAPVADVFQARSRRRHRVLRTTAIRRRSAMGSMLRDVDAVDPHASAWGRRTSAAARTRSTSRRPRGDERDPLALLARRVKCARRERSRARRVATRDRVEFERGARIAAAPTGSLGATISGLLRQLLSSGARWRRPRAAARRALRDRRHRACGDRAIEDEGLRGCPRRAGR